MTSVEILVVRGGKGTRRDHRLIDVRVPLGTSVDHCDPTVRSVGVRDAVSISSDVRQPVNGGVKHESGSLSVADGGVDS